ncbi:MAG: peptidoglycan-binding protein [Cyanobacteria bacterium P01_F01_bin.150]
MLARPSIFAQFPQLLVTLAEACRENLADTVFAAKRSRRERKAAKRRAREAKAATESSKTTPASTPADPKGSKPPEPEKKKEKSTPSDAEPDSISSESLASEPSKSEPGQSKPTASEKPKPEPEAAKSIESEEPEPEAEAAEPAAPEEPKPVSEVAEPTVADESEPEVAEPIASDELEAEAEKPSESEEPEPEAAEPIVSEEPGPEEEKPSESEEPAEPESEAAESTVAEEPEPEPEAIEPTASEEPEPEAAEPSAFTSSKVVPESAPVLSEPNISAPSETESVPEPAPAVSDESIPSVTIPGNVPTPSESSAPTPPEPENETAPTFTESPIGSAPPEPDVLSTVEPEAETRRTFTPKPHIVDSSVTYSTLASASSYNSDNPPGLYDPAQIDTERFNTLLGDAHILGWVGKPIADINDLFVKHVVLSDSVAEAIATFQTPGFIGIHDLDLVTAPSGQLVSGHNHLAQILERDGLLLCTFQWDKERYGEIYDTRRPIAEEQFKEGFIKGEAHHVGALVPAQRLGSDGQIVQSFAAHNEPGNYHNGMYGDEGFVTLAQRLVFPDFLTREQARGYTDSIICWMGFLNPFVKFPENYNGGDPTKVLDSQSLRTFLKTGLLAALGDRDAIAFLNDPLNMTYCAEYMYITVNSVLFPFNRIGLMDLLENEAQVARILKIQTQHNRRQPTILTQAGDDAFEAVLNRTPSNPQFDAFNIALPVVPEDLPSLAQMMTDHGHAPEPNSLPFPCFTISQILRRAFRVLLPRHKTQHPKEMAAAQERMFQYVGIALGQQLGLDSGPEAQASDPALLRDKRQMVQKFMAIVSQVLGQTFDRDEAFDAAIDRLMTQADSLLVGAGDRTRFVPPRIYADLGQQDGDRNMPQGWGFKLETVGATISRRVVGDLNQRIPIEWRNIKLETPFMQGDDVKLLQGAMIRAGVSVDADGFFGPASEAAVKSYQSAYQLPVTGVIDTQTRQFLLK